MNHPTTKGTKVSNAPRSPLSLLRAALGTRRAKGSAAFSGTAAPSGPGSGAPAHASGRALAVLALTVGALLFAPAPASAGVVHHFLYSFDGSGAPGSSSFYPSGVAVDNSSSSSAGKVYVGDFGNHVVDRFIPWASSAAYDCQITAAGSATTSPSECDSTSPGAPGGSFGLPYGDAVDPATGDLYVSDFTNGVVDRFNAAGAYQSQITGFARPTGVALDRSSGDLYIGDYGNDVVYKFDPATSSLTTFATGTPAGSFGAAFMVAVDNSSGASAGDVYVVDIGNNVVDKFDSSGVYQSQITGFNLPEGVAVDPTNGHLYVADNNNGVVDEFDPSGALVSQLTGSATTAGSISPFAVAVSSAGDVYVGDSANHVVDVWGPASLPLPAVTTEPASNVAPTSATLNGTVNPEGAALSDCHFEFVPQSQYEADQYQSVTPAEQAACATADGNPISGPGEIPADSNNHAVSAGVSGLQPGAYHFRLLAANASTPTTKGQDQILGPPVILSQSTSAAAKTTATLEAQINPQGAATTYHFEYVDDATFQADVIAGGLGHGFDHAASTTPETSIGNGSSPEPASADLINLAAGTTYHYRVLATNGRAAVSGSGQTFATLPVARIDSVFASGVGPTSATLHAQINPLGDDTTCSFQYGTDTSYGHSEPCNPADLGAGNGDIAVSLALTNLQPDTTYHYRVVAINPGGPAGTAYSGDHTFVYDTTGAGLPDNRAYEMVTPPQKNGAAIGRCPFCVPWDVSEDGSRLVAVSIQPFAGSGSGTAIRQEEGERYAFARTPAGWVTEPLGPPATQFATNTDWGASADTGANLFSSPTPPGGEDDFYARRPDGTIFDIGPATPPSAGPLPSGYPFPGPEAATADLSHLVYSIQDGSGKTYYWPFDPTNANTVSTYEYVGAGNPEPLLVGVSGGTGSTDLISVCGTDVGSPSGRIYNALSADGSTVFFTARACGSSPPADALFARIDQSRTVPVSERSPTECTGTCQSSPPSAAVFEGASRSGSTVFFTSTQRLTDAASEDSTSGDGAGTGAGEVGCTKTTGPNGCNLYLYDSPQEEPPSGRNLIAVSAGDTSGGGPQVQGVMAISPDGSHVYFVAKGVLTTAPNAQGQTAQAGADNLYAYERDARYPNGHTAFIATLSPSDEEQWHVGVGEANVTPDGRFLVFTSHAALTPDDTSTSGAAQVFRYDAQTGELVRVSIGERGFNDNGNAGTADASIARLLFGHLGSTRSDPTMSHDGAYVFFQSPVGLTPQALSTGAQNVYEWEAEGSGGCARAAGCVSLISDGRDASVLKGRSSVHLVGADATGANVFFTTADALVPQDTNTELDFYDARIGGGFPAAGSPAPCQADACRGASGQAPAAIAARGSANGPGNAHHRRHHKKHHRHHKRHAPRAKPRHLQRAGHNRGGVK